MGARAGKWVSRFGFVLSLALATNASTALADSGSYRAVRLAGPGSVARLEVRLGEERFLDVLKVNRIDRAHALEADTLLLPGDSLGLMDLSPWPLRLAAIDSIPKVILVSMRIQAFAAYEHGNLARWGPISSGGPNAPTREGRYSVGWKDAMHVSSVNSSWIMPWTVNIDREIGTALHQYSLPGLPASHCCIRLLEEDASWVYGWVTTWKVARDGKTVLVPGTPVVLFGTYDYPSPPPWRRLAIDPAVTDLTPGEMAAALQLLLRSD